MPAALEREIARIEAQTGGVVGVAARHLGNGLERNYRARVQFPMASTYKVAIGACALQWAERGDRSLATQIPVELRQRSTSSILSSYFPHAALAVSLHDLLELMLTSSDNTATDVLLEAIGGPPAVQRCLDEAGVTDMRVDRTTAQILRQFAALPEPRDPSRSFLSEFDSVLGETWESIYLQDGKGANYLAYESDPRDHATPEAMTRLLAMIWTADWPSQESAAVIRDILARSREPVRIGRGLPEGTALAHKTGTLSATVNDAGVFDLPAGQGKVAITVYLKGALVPWEPAEEAIGQIARAVHDDFAQSSNRATPAASVAATPVASIDWHSPCPFSPGAGDLQARLACGYLEVPERAERPAGPHIRLPFALIRSSSEQPRPDPVVFLHGGPGAAPLEAANTIERFAAHPFALDRDIILYNQRGSKMTAPALECDALDVSRAAYHAADLTLEERDARIAASAIACRDEMRGRGLDLDAYDAKANAADLRELRKALGIEQWNVLAVSYGTWMALAAVEADRQGLRSLILDSVMSRNSDLFMSEGPRNFAIGLDRLLAACSADGSCAGAFPDLAERLRRVLGSLEKEPVILRVSEGGEQPSLEVTVNWHDLLGVLHWMLYDAKMLRLVPLLIDRTSHGDLRLLGIVMEKVYPAFRRGAPGPTAAFFTIVCNDQYTARNPLPIAPANADYRGFSIVSFMPKVCAGGARAAGAKPAPAPLRSDIPTLLLSGHFDPMTPDVYAMELARDLTRARHFTIAASGHSTLSVFDSCQTRVAQQFLDTLDPARMHECLAELPQPQFALRMDEAEALLMTDRALPARTRFLPGPPQQSYHSARPYLNRLQRTLPERSHEPETNHCIRTGLPVFAGAGSIQGIEVRSHPGPEDRPER